MTDPIRVDSTSATSAETLEPVVLWVSPNGRRRLAFVANLHANPNSPDACLSGELRYQSKRDTDDFVDEESLSLNNLHATQWTRYHIPSEAVLELFRALGGFYELHSTTGIPRRRYLLVPVDFQEGDPATAADVIDDVVGWLRASTDPRAVVDALLRNDPANARYLNSSSAAVSLNQLLVEWDALARQPEPRWHDLLRRHEWVIEQVLGQPLVLFQDEAQVSAPTARRKRAAYVDFMCQNPHTTAIALVEIKRADTPLLQDEPYRGEAYAPSDELAGAVAQVQYYRETFERDIDVLMREETVLRLAQPKCVLIVGDTRALNTRAKMSSFERFRAGVVDVEILTFNELRSRVEGYLAVVTGEVFEE